VLGAAAAREHVCPAAAEVLYITLTLLARPGIELALVEGAPPRRALKVTRRD
jgi:hypothetical protein